MEYLRLLARSARLRPAAALFAFTAALVCQPAWAQEPAPPAAPPARDDNTIVVLGNPADMPVVAEQVITFGMVSRRLGAESERFSRCAPMPDRAVLSTILDGRPTLQRTQMALHRYLATNRGCYSGQSELLPAPQLGVCNPEATGFVSEGGVHGRGWGQPSSALAATSICRVTYDRGALFERALREVVGDLRLTRDDTFDADVRARFAERETARNLARGAIDRNYFNTVACMVQIVPEAGVGMVLAPAGSDRAEQAREALIANGGPCVGYAREVRADPGQFRAYVAEAVYSWIAATRDRPSLIVRDPATY